MNFSKRTIGLILMLIIVATALLLAAISQNQYKNQKNKTVSLKPSPTITQRFTLLSFSPNPVIVSQKQTASPSAVDIVINTNQQKISGVQLEISYDPKKLTNVSITPSTFFPDPIVLIKEINNKEGVITFALSIQPTGIQRAGKGVVAQMKFNHTLTTGEKTQITFLPKTLVTALGISSSVLKQITTAVVMFQDSTSP